MMNEAANNSSARVSAGLSAAVLAGGQSQRMGTDKALLRAGTMTLLERTIRTLTTIFDDVFVVGRRPGYGEYGVPVVADDYSGAGTLGGIATALRRAAHERVCVVACDMPLLSARLLEAMAMIDTDADVIVPVRQAVHPRQGLDVTLEPLHAIYARTCIGPIERRIHVGDLRAVGFYEDVRVHMLDETWLRSIDPELASLINTNTPVEFQRALEWLGADLIAQGEIVG